MRGRVWRVKPGLLHSSYPTSPSLFRPFLQITRIERKMDYCIEHYQSTQIGIRVEVVSVTGKKGGPTAVFLSTESEFSAQGARI
jgi:hypothetical protein